MAGSPPAVPSLAGIGQRMASKDVVATIRHGKGRMPGFSNLSDDQVAKLEALRKNGPPPPPPPPPKGDKPAGPPPMMARS